MSGLALTLILAAALVHASWNYLLKKSGGGIGFVWLFGALMGTQLLLEGQTGRRIACAGAMAVGVILLAIG